MQRPKFRRIRLSTVITFGAALGFAWTLVGPVWQGWRRLMISTPAEGRDPWSDRVRRRGSHPLVTAILLAAVMVIGTAPPARAADDVADPARVEELIRQANDFRRQGHDERAMPLLRQAYDIARTPRTTGQLGLVELALGYWGAAHEHLSEALAIKSHPWIDRNRSTLESALKSAKSHLVDLTVEGKPAGAEVFLNGKSVGTLPLAGPLAVNEGKVEVELRAAGHRAATRTLTLSGGGRERLILELMPTNEGTPRPVASVSSDAVATPVPPPKTEAATTTAASDGEADATSASLPAWRRILPWSLLGGAAVAGMVGVWQHVSWRGTQKDFDAIPECGQAAPMRGSDPRCQGLYDDFSVQKTRAYVAYGAAAALGLGAAALFIVNATSSPDSNGAPGQLSLVINPAGMGISCRVPF